MITAQEAHKRVMPSDEEWAKWEPEIEKKIEETINAGCLTCVIRNPTSDIADNEARYLASIKLVNKLESLGYSMGVFKDQMVRCGNAPWEPHIVINFNRLKDGK